MLRISTSILSAAVLVLACASVQAQQFEVVHKLNYPNPMAAKAALDALFEDDAMKDGNATLYAYDVGHMQSSHLVVEDFEGYGNRDAVDKSRRSSQAWSNYMLTTHDAEYLGSELIMVAKDHGEARHTAGYLAAFLINTSDAGAYAKAIDELNKAEGNPGVLRLVALRTGDRAVTHAVLIGGDDFAAVNDYLDELYESDGFQKFTSKVKNIRKVVGITMYRRIGSWGY